MTALELTAPFSFLSVPLSVLVPVSTLFLPFVGGALRINVSNRSFSVLAKVAAVLSGVYPSLVLFNEMVNSFGIAVANAGEYSQLMLGFGVASICVSWLLVSFGEQMGKNDGIRISNGIGTISEEVKSHFQPLLDEFNDNTGQQISRLRSAVEGFSKNIIDAFNSKAKGLEDQNGQLSSRYTELLEKYNNRTENYGIMVKGYNSFQESFNALLKEYHKDLESMRSMQADLATRIEVYEKMKQFQDERELERREKEVSSSRERNLQSSSGTPLIAPSNQQPTATTLTRDDGRASQNIGDKTEEEFASAFRDAGILVERRKAQGDPDITLLSSDGSNKVVAVVNTKSYMLYDEPKRNQRHISRDDIIPEIVAAQKHKVPVIIAVKNRYNGRKWLFLIPFEQIANWNGVSTPVMLSKNDPESGNELKEMFRKLLRELGGKV